MRFNEFEALAWEQWERVPETYKGGVDGLIIERDAKPHPDFDEIYTLGECATESFPSPYGGPDTVRSAVVLYYGSFLRLSRLDAAFDWEEELWETITHELKHHLEALAVEDALEDFDYAVDENFRRVEGEAFDPLFFRAGEPIGANRYRVDRDIFIEIDPGTQEDVLWIEFDWEGRRYRIPRPDNTADICFVRLDAGPDLDGDLFVVLVPRRNVWTSLRSIFSRSAPTVVQTEAHAELST